MLDGFLWKGSFDDTVVKPATPSVRPPIGGSGVIPSVSTGVSASQGENITDTDIGVPLSSSQDLFSDVTVNDWFYEAVRYVTENGLMNGTATGVFSPNLAVTRAMLVIVLYRREGQPDISGDIPFSDVNNSEWYSDAILRASQNDTVLGYGNGTFGPDDLVTREQAVTILYRYTKAKGLDVSESADLSAYSDTGDISDWAMDAMRWAVPLIRGMQKKCGIIQSVMNV